MNENNPKRKSLSAKDKQAMARMDRLLASQIGGFGVCGRPICCATWLKGAADISISLKMVRSQKVTLDPALINGCCHHMKCCLSFELPKNPPHEESSHASPLSENEPKDNEP